MKVVILGDTHFGSGYSLGGTHPYKRINTRLVDFLDTFDYVVDYMVKNSIFHLVITGDVFESKKPHASELSLFAEKICRLEKLGIFTYIIVGNHDLIREQNTSTLGMLQNLQLPKTFIYSNVDSAICNDGTNSINLVFFPFRTRQMLDCKTNEEAIKRLSNFLHFELQKFKGGPKILVGHSLLQGTRLGNVVLTGSAGEVVLPIDMFNELDAVVMGHVHAHQIIKESNPMVTYVGSMERKDFGDSDLQKYFLVVDNSDKNLLFKFEPLPLRSLNDISLDHTKVENVDEINDKIIQSLVEADKKKALKNSIVRLTVLIKEKHLFSLNQGAIKKFLYEGLSINFCVGIFPQVMSERQLRKASITERKTPIEAFSEFLEMEESEEMREKMREFGLKIIQERGSDVPN